MLHISSRKSALTTMVVTNLLILLIPLAMGLFLYAKVEKSLRTNANRSNTAMLEQLRLSVDQKLTEVDKLMRQVALDPKLDYMLKIRDGADGADRYNFVDLHDKMRRYGSLVSSFIFDYYVYFAESDTIVKEDFVSDSRSFYDTHYFLKNMPYNQWRQELLAGEYRMAYLPAAELARPASSESAEYMPEKVVLYAQTLPFLSASERLGNFFALIDVGQVKQMFAQIEMASHSEIYIVDGQGRTIMSTSDKPLPGELLSHIQLTKEPFEYRLEGADQMVSFTSSLKTDWNYISVTPNGVFMQQVDQIKNWSSWLFAFCVIAGLIAVSVGAYRNYKPLQKTVHAIMSGKGIHGRAASAVNEYEFIRETIAGSILEEKSLRSALAQQTPFIRANYLSRLIHGYMDVDVSAESAEKLRFMELSFISDRFAVILVKIESVSGMAEEESERQWAHARFIVSNIGTDLIEQPAHRGHSVELNRDTLAFLVNLNEKEANLSSAESEADIRSFAEALFTIVAEKFRIELTVAAGGIHQGPKAIRDSYPEAVAALEYRLILGKKSIIHYQDIVDTKQHYYYPLEIEVQLINFVRSGDADNAGKLLDKIYSMNFGAAHITPELGRCLFFNLTSTLLKIVNSANASLEAELGPDFDPIKTVFSYPTAEGMRFKTKELYETLARSFNVERSDHHVQLLQAILELVERNVDNPDLGLAMVAEHFEMSPQYISTFFKKNHGHNLMDYITRKRMEQAKSLMGQNHKELTNADIARKVGYQNDVVFIRAFKKLEGVTPGKYRELLLQDKTGSDS
ncbi:helix-turn-helix domain-containing protein [Paenibacillus silvisoli]|uniref:helix-turn-helix domain-containing protein n=1 Tax=Paenibacillus silvisoli TaxID=3110539 RepID=UPI0028046C6C|nr:helix-turn-helix domain-containing protein [Paenibacillus silvisoli]